MVIQTDARGTRMMVNRQLLFSVQLVNTSNNTLLPGRCPWSYFFFFLNDPAPTEFYPFPLHAALPLFCPSRRRTRRRAATRATGFDASASIMTRAGDVPPPRFSDAERRRERAARRL